MAKSKEPKPAAYRVVIDYRAANIFPGSSTKDKGFYQNLAGVNALIHNAINSGVHPKFITVEVIYGEFEFTRDIAALSHCTCGNRFDEEAAPGCYGTRRVQERNENLREDIPRLKPPHNPPLIIEEMPG